MRHDTRKEILNTAKRLFNERGYNNVSTGDIAGALGISKGNLTYYFKKKEEMIEAILAENPNTRMHEAPQTIAELNGFFEDIQRTVRENAYYFWHYTQLAQVSPTIQSMQAAAFQENTVMLEQVLWKLARDGMIKEERYAGEYKRLIDTLLLCSVYWVPFCDLKKAPAEGFSGQAWSIMYPFLTDRGIEELQRMQKGGSMCQDQ